MKDLKLLVLGDRKTTNTFKLLGAEVINLQEVSKKDVVKYLDEKKDEIGGVFLQETFYNQEGRVVRRLSKGDVPWIVLPAKESEGDLGFKELEKLAEKAIGMKLNY